ncbi:hypothetical protein [Streptomyces caatingaensis]|uniref:Uncharacterized protein n=1 Tax=Streptomyces caatingaensis TaxID=1678637 RepID=A0A0K9X949_9ACTN|nr:hypothetical protein [Streptomyces caatingaensis]KNB49970.1 hypothetical protein AC230_24940 [Streptomyces caatingaensis]
MPDMDEIIGRIRRDMDSQLRKRARRALGEGVDRAGWAAARPDAPAAAAAAAGSAVPGPPEEGPVPARPQ